MSWHQGHSVQRGSPTLSWGWGWGWEWGEYEIKLIERESRSEFLRRIIDYHFTCPRDDIRINNSKIFHRICFKQYERLNTKDRRIKAGIEPASSHVRSAVLLFELSSYAPKFHYVYLLEKIFLAGLIWEVWRREIIFFLSLFIEVSNNY